MRVLVTDSDNRSTLAATRSLARAGHTVITAGERQDSLAAVSRFSTAFFQYPRPFDEPERFVDAVCHSVRVNSIDVVLPMTEVTTLLLTEGRSRLPSSCALPFASVESIVTASDKAAVAELARRIGVPMPRTVIVGSEVGAFHEASALTFPIVIKPGRSRVRSVDGWISTRVAYAVDAADLESKLHRLRPDVFPVLLQERILGRGVGVFACYDQGRPVAFFSHERLREKPPSGGVSVLSRSTALDPIAVDYAKRLLDQLRWHGVAMVEFKQDDRDGSLKLMEINGRFWGSLQLAINAGVNFPVLLVDIAAGRAPSPVLSYKTGVGNRWLLGDVDVLLAVLFGNRGALHLPVDFPSRMKFLWDFMHLWGRDLHYEVWSLADPRPGLIEFRRWLTNR